MGTTQDVYNQTQPALVQGQKVNGEEYNAVSRTVETVAGIPFGHPAMRGSADLGCVIATAAATAATFMGIVVRDLTVPANTPGKVPQYDTATVLQRGAVAVQVGEAVSDGDPVFWSPADGKYYNDNGGATRAECFGFEFDSTTALNGLAIIVRRKG
jgi:hypothetical protein